jgi:hypothetical protein
MKTLKEMRANINELQEKRIKQHDDDIMEILASKKLIEKTFASHTKVIGTIEMEIQRMESERGRVDNVRTDTDKKEETQDELEKFKKTKCRYFDKGFCRYRNKCRYFHPQKTCEEYLRSSKCDHLNCEDRHPEACKYWKSTNKCKRNENCDFLHATFAKGDDGIMAYKCVSCKNSWNDKNCVVKYSINGRETFFCLNCEDWVKIKTKVYDANWTLYDESGNLKVDV